MGCSECIARDLHERRGPHMQALDLSDQPLCLASTSRAISKQSPFGLKSLPTAHAAVGCVLALLVDVLRAPDVVQVTRGALYGCERILFRRRCLFPFLSLALAGRCAYSGGPGLTVPVCAHTNSSFALCPASSLIFCAVCCCSLPLSAYGRVSLRTCTFRVFRFTMCTVGTWAEGRARKQFGRAADAVQQAQNMAFLALR